MVDLISQFCSCFTRILVMNLTIGLGGAVGLAINRIILIGINVVINFFGLFLW